MKQFYASLWVFVAATLVSTAADTPITAPSSLSALRESGAFSFPQREAKVLCDRGGLRFSVWNNDEYLFAQAVLWEDGDASLGKTEDNREIGDWSVIELDLDANGKPTPNVNRDYLLNPWPGQEGLHYQIILGDRSSTSIQSDSKGRGAIRYVEVSEGKKVRVDTYLISLRELSRRVGDRIRLCYWGFSPQPPLTVNSTDFEHGGKSYYPWSIPFAKYQEYILARGHAIDATQVPDGQKDASLSQRKNVSMPKIGEAAREISAHDWINLDRPPTLASLRGKVVLVEFWATWCGPCVAGIPHLNDLYHKHEGKNFQLLSFVEEGHSTMDKFLTRKQVDYPIGLESSSLEDYGVEGIPQAFLIDASGKIIWQGHSAAAELDDAISAALNAAK
jgi:thiol-disulfide isomerase/thioredoxin